MVFVQVISFQSLNLQMVLPVNIVPKSLFWNPPFDKVDELSKLTFDASFKDNEGGTAGAFHADGVDVMVKINDKEYNLKYKL